ncbi:MAG: glycine cleavage T C-terminal barrel domain-containing protein [Brachybacterium sp.]
MCGPATEGFPKTYGITHPREQWLSDRPLRTSPFHPRTEALGAQYFEAAGWERPQWYESNAGLAAEHADRIPEREAEWDRRWWSPIIEAEHLAMRERVALIDLGAFAIFDVCGPGALDLLEQLAVARIDVPIGRVVYTPLLTPRGTFRSDLTIVRRGPQDFRVITGGAEGARDLAWLRAHLPGDGSAHLMDVTSAVSSLGLWGPRARDLLARVTDHDLSDASFGFGTAQDVQIGSVPASLLRISYVGELGWEIHVPTEHGLRLWDELWRQGQDLGLLAAGIGVYGTTGRLEKGYRLMGAELTGEYDPVEADLALPKVKTHDFVGRDAYLAARRGDPAALLCTLAVEAGSARGVARCMTGGEPVLSLDGAPLIDGKGRPSAVTSAGPGPSLGRYLLMAYLPPQQAVAGTALQVEHLGHRHPVTVLTAGRTPAFDPQDARMKG